MTRYDTKELVGVFLATALSAIAIFALTAPSRARLAEAEFLHMGLKENYGRLRGLIDQTGPSDEDNAPDLSPLHWSGPDPTTKLQGMLVAAAEAEGIQVNLFGPGSPPQEAGLDAFASEIEFETSNPTLIRFLGRVENISPPVSVAGLWVRPGSTMSSEATVTVRLTVWGLKQSGAVDVSP